MLESLDVDEGGAQYLPYAQLLMRGLKVVLASMGLTHGRKHVVTPDGAGMIYLRTRRGPASPNESPLPRAPYSQESRIDEWYDYIRIELATGSGYIARISTLTVGTGRSPYSIPIWTAKSLQPFLSYNYPTGVSPQRRNRELVSQGILTAGTQRGYFQKTRFTPFAAAVGAPVDGAFVHQYVDTEGQDARRILIIRTNGDIVDSHTNTILTRTGPAFGSPTFLTFSISNDGRSMIMERDPTLGDPTTPNAQRLDIDFAANPQIVASAALTGTPPYGTVHTAYTGERSRIETRSATYPGIAGVDARTGETVAISFRENATAEILGQGWTPGTLAVFGAALGPQLMQIKGPAYSGSFPDVYPKAHSIAATHTLTVRLPDEDETEHTFTMNEVTAESTVTADFVNATVSGSGTSRLSALGILYADPQIPIVFYSLHTTEIVSSGGETHAVPALGTIRRMPFTATTRWSREVGVVSPAGRRILHTETGPIVTGAGPHLKDHFIVGLGDGGGAGGDADDAYVYTSISGGEDAHTPDTEDAADIPVDVGFFQQLKFVTRTRAFPTASFGSLDRGFHFPNDVSNVNFDWTKEPRYWVAVADKDTWLFGMHRSRDLDGNTINDLQLYSGNLNETNLRERFLAYLLEAAQAADTPDPALIAALSAGEIGAYDVGLSNVSRIPMV